MEETSPAVRDMPPETDAPEHARKILRWEWLLLAAFLVLLLATRFPTLDQRLLEDDPSSFRQTQTAFQTVEFHRLGIDLLHPMVPVLGSPWELPFEFPAFQAAASVVMSWGFDADLANRITGLFFFAVTAVLLWALLRMMAGRFVAAVALFVFAASPFSLLWSRSATIEYLATAAALGWVMAALQWRRSGRWSWAAGGIALGSLAMVVKITTALPWALPILLYQRATEAADRPLSKTWMRIRTRPGFISMLALPAVAGLVWTRYADSIKGANEATAGLTSSALWNWNFGTIEQRFNFEYVTRVLGRVDALLLGRGWLVIAILGVVLVRRNRSFWLGVLLVPVVAVGTFFNLYVEHEYYLAAISPALAAMLALGIRQLVTWVEPRTRRTVLISVLISIGWVTIALGTTRDRWTLAYEERQPGPATVEIAEFTEPDDLVIVAEGDWNPKTLYYADRRGMMLKEEFVSYDLMLRQPDLADYSLFYTFDAYSPDVDFASVRPWFAPANHRALVLAGSYAGLGPTEVAGTVEPLSSAQAGQPGVEVDLGRTAISCDGQDSMAVPSGGGSLWLSIEAVGQGRPQIDLDLVPMPSQTRTLVLAPPAGTSERMGHELRCVGDGQILIKTAVESLPA